MGAIALSMCSATLMAQGDKKKNLPQREITDFPADVDLVIKLDAERGVNEIENYIQRITKDDASRKAWTEFLEYTQKAMQEGDNPAPDSVFKLLPHLKAYIQLNMSDIPQVVVDVTQRADYLKRCAEYEASEKDDFIDESPVPDFADTIFYRIGFVIEATNTPSMNILKDEILKDTSVAINHPVKNGKYTSYYGIRDSEFEFFKEVRSPEQILQERYNTKNPVAQVAFIQNCLFYHSENLDDFIAEFKTNPSNNLKKQGFIASPNDIINVIGKIEKAKPFFSSKFAQSTGSGKKGLESFDNYLALSQMESCQFYLKPRVAHLAISYKKGTPKPPFFQHKINHQYPDFIDVTHYPRKGMLRFDFYQWLAEIEKMENRNTSRFVNVIAQIARISPEKVPTLLGTSFGIAQSEDSGFILWGEHQNQKAIENLIFSYANILIEKQCITKYHAIKEIREIWVGRYIHVAITPQFFCIRVAPQVLTDKTISKQKILTFSKQTFHKKMNFEPVPKANQWETHFGRYNDAFFVGENLIKTSQAISYLAEKFVEKNDAKESSNATKALQNLQTLIQNCAEEIDKDQIMTIGRYKNNRLEIEVKAVQRP